MSKLTYNSIDIQLTPNHISKNREDTPWYPSVRLYRQPSPGDWLSVIEKIKISLANFASEFLSKGK